MGAVLEASKGRSSPFKCLTLACPVSRMYGRLLLGPRVRGRCPQQLARPWVQLASCRKYLMAFAYGTRRALAISTRQSQVEAVRGACARSNYTRDISHYRM